MEKVPVAQKGESITGLKGCKFVSLCCPSIIIKATKSGEPLGEGGERGAPVWGEMGCQWGGCGNNAIAHIPNEGITVKGVCLALSVSEPSRGEGGWGGGGGLLTQGSVMLWGDVVLEAHITLPLADNLAVQGACSHQWMASKMPALCLTLGRVSLSSGCLGHWSFSILSSGTICFELMKPRIQSALRRRGPG